MECVYLISMSGELSEEAEFVLRSRKPVYFLDYPENPFCPFGVGGTHKGISQGSLLSQIRPWKRGLALRLGKDFFSHRNVCIFRGERSSQEMHYYQP